MFHCPDWIKKLINEEHILFAAVTFFLFLLFFFFFRHSMKQDFILLQIFWVCKTKENKQEHLIWISIKKPFFDRTKKQQKRKKKHFKSKKWFLLSFRKKNVGAENRKRARVQKIRDVRAQKTGNARACAQKTGDARAQKTRDARACARRKPETHLKT